MNLDTSRPDESIIPLHQTTWELDAEEGAAVNLLKATHTAALADPLIEVPPDLERNLAVTSMDALLYGIMQLHEKIKRYSIQSKRGNANDR